MRARFVDPDSPLQKSKKRSGKRHVIAIVSVVLKGLDRVFVSLSPALALRRLLRQTARVIPRAALVPAVGRGANFASCHSLTARCLSARACFSK